MDSNYALGNARQYQENAVAGEGIYNFEISFSPIEYEKTEIRFKLINESNTYGFAGITIDSTNSTDMDYFNCFSIALDSGNTTTALHLHEMSYTYGDPIDLPEWVTSVEQPENRLPVKFSLSQNFPNPFNPKTVIRYKIKVKSNVELSIYNLLGQKVATLVDENQTAGKYKVEWNARSFSSGVYLCRLEAGGFLETKKLILLK